MASSRLPNEILFRMLLDAVKNRTLKRALRLRLVCKTFADVVPEIIYSSGVLDRALCFEKNGLAFFQRYVAYQVHRIHEQSPRYVWEVRQVTEAIFHEQAPRVGFNSFEQADLILCVALLSVRGKHFRARHADFVRYADPETIGRAQSQALIIKQLTFSAAAYLNMHTLVNKLLAEGFDYYSDSSFYKEPCFESPIECASRAGHVDMLHLLAFDLALNRNDRRLRKIMAGVAAEADQDLILEMVLAREPLPWETLGIEPTPSSYAELLEIILPHLPFPSLRKIYDAWSSEMPYSPQLRKALHPCLLGRNLRLRCASGSVEAFDYLRSFGVPVFGSRDPTHSACLEDDTFCEHPVVIAAANGHYHLVKHLLDIGVGPSHALISACRAGCADLVDLLLDARRHCSLKYSMSETTYQFALFAAIERENCDLVRHLLKRLQLQQATLRAATSYAASEGLESMAALLHDFLPTVTP